ncbi:hypothetical protein GQ600_22546 [Phytophthora cactorum]|nr:hypothetical protein GQ600_22546 [Phytophthora cactorum]
MFEEESDMGGLPPPGNGNCENCDSRLWRADHGTFSSQSGRATRNLEAACAFPMHYEELRRTGYDLSGIYPKVSLVTFGSACSQVAQPMGIRTYASYNVLTMSKAILTSNRMSNSPARVFAADGQGLIPGMAWVTSDESLSGSFLSAKNAHLQLYRGFATAHNKVSRMTEMRRCPLILASSSMTSSQLPRRQQPASQPGHTWKYAVVANLRGTAGKCGDLHVARAGGSQQGARTGAGGCNCGQCYEKTQGIVYGFAINNNGTCTYGTDCGTCDYSTGSSASTSGSRTRAPDL